MKSEAKGVAGKRYGKYEVLTRLAVGGMAEIFLGFGHQGLFAGRPVVLKRIGADQREDNTALDALINEAKLTARLSHPNIAQVLDLERDGDDVVVVIEFVQGANAHELKEQAERDADPLPLGLALSLFRDAATALHLAHTHRDSQGAIVPIVHRDVTPKNLMMDFEGTGRVLDFGIARLMNARRRTAVGMVRGTTAYMSPEQASGKLVDPQSDLFSLGIVLHELVTGKTLFHRNSSEEEMLAVCDADIFPPSQRNKSVPPAVDAVVLKCLERRKDKRYASAQALLNDFNRMLGNVSMAKDKRGAELSRRFAQRKKSFETWISLIPKTYHERTTEPSRPKIEREDSTVLVGAGEVTQDARNKGTDREEAQTVIELRNAAQRNNDALKPGLRELKLQGPQIQRPSSGRNTRVLAFSFAALAMGGAGGALWVKSRPAAAASSVNASATMSLSSDRPVQVFDGDTLLGATPLDGVSVTPGMRAFTLIEADGRKRAMEVTFRAGDTPQLNVVLDSLPLLP